MLFETVIRENMILRYKFFQLTIYRRSYKKYECAENTKQKMIKGMESCWQKPYKDIPEKSRFDAEDRCWFPPWRFNDIIGFVDVGLDPHNRITGDIFLQRRYFKDGYGRQS